MAKMIKATSTFLANREVWLEGETKEATDTQAAELVAAGLAMEVEEAEPAKETKAPKTEKTK